MYTDLIEEKSIKNISSTRRNYGNITVVNSKYNKYKYTSIYYTNKDNYYELEDILIRELKKYIKLNNKDIILVVGLGNDKSTPDSLGPCVIDNIFVTRHLKLLNILDNTYRSVSTFKPGVMGSTGLESISLIKSVIKDLCATKVIIVDSLKTNNIDRLVNTIQITDSGIHPGSGINNDRGEVSKKVLGIDVISIGIPTVVDIRSILKEDINNSLILTPTDIDYQIDSLSKVVSNSINKTLNKRLYPTK